MIGYKVVFVTQGARCSTFMYGTHWVVWYAQDRVAVPEKKCGPLCYFTTLQGAVDYVINELKQNRTQEDKNIEIWECDAEPSQAICVWVVEKGDCWQIHGENKEIQYEYPHRMYKDVGYADKITLLRKVREYEAGEMRNECDV